MSRMTNKKYIWILFIFSTLLNHVKNSFVLCDDDETACPSNYICCKRDKGYYCCYKTMVCCNKGQSCCDTDFLGELKKIQEKPKIAISLIQMKNQIENITLNLNPKDNMGLVDIIQGMLGKIKKFINKNLRQREQFDLKLIEELIENIRSSLNDADSFVNKIFEINWFLIEELDKVVNGFFNEFKGSEIYEKLVDLLTKLLK